MTSPTSPATENARVGLGVVAFDIRSSSRFGVIHRLLDLRLSEIAVGGELEQVGATEARQRPTFALDGAQRHLDAIGNVVGGVLLVHRDVVSRRGETAPRSAVAQPRSGTPSSTVAPANGATQPTSM